MPAASKITQAQSMRPPIHKKKMRGATQAAWRQRIVDNISFITSLVTQNILICTLLLGSKVKRANAAR